MAKIVRNRTIRPSSRLEVSKSYKIDTSAVTKGDTLVVNIDHESKPFLKTYRFNGADVADKKSISFRVNDNGSSIEISWSGASPISSTESKPVINKTTNKKVAIDSVSSTFKTSFDPISASETQVLILGTMPGDKSIELGEYYAHPRNRFWKIISVITDNEVPVTYSEKKDLLLKTKIGIWDVAQKANREGSLDNAIKEEIPNDLDKLINQHKNLKVIAFNGKKSEKLFDKYFNRKRDIKYVSLPSTSPANTGINFEDICEQWRQINNR